MQSFENIENSENESTVEGGVEVVESADPVRDSNENSDVVIPETEEIVETAVSSPVEVSDTDRLHEIRAELFDGVDVNGLKSEEVPEESIPEHKPITISSDKKTGGIVNTLRRWMGIAGVAAVGFGAMQESQAQSVPEHETKKESVLGGVLRWAQRVDGEMAIEKKMYGNRWSPGPNEHTELRTVNGYAADVVDVVHVDQQGNVVRVLQRAVHRKDVPVGITVGISGGHGQGRVFPGQRRPMPTNLYQANMMKQQGVNIGTMVRSATGKVTMEVKPVKK